MLWYLLKTWAGQEEKLVEEIHRTVSPDLYDEAFVIYTERIWRREGRSRIHTEPLFKGCAFLTCRAAMPLFQWLEQIPAMSRMLMDGTLSLYPLREEDVTFLQTISGEAHVLRLSYMLREYGSDLYRVNGPLEHCLSEIEDIEFRKRFVKIRRKLWGEDTVLVMGILLKEDLEQKQLIENREASAPAEMPGGYRFLEIGRDADGRKTYQERRPVTVLPGGYEEMIKVG